MAKKTVFKDGSKLIEYDVWNSLKKNFKSIKFIFLL
jgi:hypothetical protein